MASTTVYHITDDGPKKCTASPGNCPLGGEHFPTVAEARKGYEDQRSSETLTSVRRAAKSPILKEFSASEHYGNWDPRTVQLSALNGVREALEEDDQTQLVAACGTGKTYMGRQLMRHQMEQPGANGVAIVLTSSIRLATDTAAELRPNKKGVYDQSFGELHKDYEVIEIHSDSTEVTTEGAVDMDKIAKQWNDALEAGKKVVIVSTYQSADKVKAVQNLIGDKAEADLLMNDEAHNILGQKNSSSKRKTKVEEEDLEEEAAGEDEANQNAGYVSFHNEIPGAIQAKKRLYATATPVISEPTSQKATINSEETALEDLKGYAATMEVNPKLRMTVFSTDKMVGKIGGFITKEEAVKEKCLADSNYQLRSARVFGVESPDDLVDANGILVGPATPKAKHYLSAQTYAATVSVLEAMVEEPGKESNGSHNALIYANGISQAEAFKENFPLVAKQLSGNMDLALAKASVNSEDPELRKRARMRLLAKDANVLVAHSKSLKGDKEAAFAMFKGKDVKAEDAVGGWSPKKNILSNVDIFSEGVSLNEIDTVVIANPSKTSERALTQAAGRAARKIGDNDYKTVGHVIIPRVVGDDGEELNGTFVNRAAYGASSLERSVTVKSLSGVAVPEDTTTMVTVYDGDKTQIKRAYELVHKHDTGVDAYLTAQTIDLVRRGLTSGGKSDSQERKAKIEHFRQLNSREKELYVRSEIASRAMSEKTKDSGAHWAKAHGVLEANKSAPLDYYRQAAIVTSLALAKDDFTFVAPEIRTALTRSGAIGNKSSSVEDVTTEDKTEFLKSRKSEVLAAIVHPHAATSQAPAVQRLVKAVAEGEPDRNAFRYLNTGTVGSSSILKSKAEQSVATYTQNLDRLLDNPEFVRETYDVLTSKDKATAKSFEAVKGVFRTRKIDLDSEAAAVEERALQRKTEKVVNGESGFSRNQKSFTNGYLTADALRSFAEAI